MFLTDSDLLTLAAPLQRPHAIRRWLDRVGIPYIVGPTGWPRVLQTSVGAVAGHAKPEQNRRPSLHL